MVAEEVDQAAVRRQLEYYFSDSNLPRDKFLRAKTEENPDGYVDISVLLSFKRLQALHATPAHIAAAVEDSTLLAIDDSAKRVRRVKPLPETPLFNTRAVFAKGWIPGSTPPEIDDIMELFSPSGKVLSVRIRRWLGNDGKKHFKGSLFVEMESSEAAERVVAEEYEIEVPGENGNMQRKQLLLLPVDEYFEQKRAETRKYRARKERTRGEKRKKPDSDFNAEGNGVQVKDEVKREGNMGKKEDILREDREIKPGLILKFDGFGPDVSREDIREAFESHGEIAWVDFQRGDSEGYIRFARAGAAKAAKEAMVEAKTEFGGKLPSFDVLAGEAEETYWKQMWAKKDAMIEQAKKRRRDNGGRAGGRGYGRRSRGGSRGRGGPHGRR